MRLGLAGNITGMQEITPARVVCCLSAGRTDSGAQPIKTKQTQCVHDLVRRILPPVRVKGAAGPTGGSGAGFDESMDVLVEDKVLGHVGREYLARKVQWLGRLCIASLATKTGERTRWELEARKPTAPSRVSGHR